jgi:CBS domain-containing membrane protein
MNQPTSALRQLRAWFPAHTQVSVRERWRALAGAGLGILFVALLSHGINGFLHESAWLVAPMGASAFLVFVLPASPMAQPWPVIVGNTVSALAGVVCISLIPDPAVAGAVAVALAIGLMFSLRCLHPPGAATALLTVLVHAGSVEFALFPVLLNSALLVLAGVLYNHLTGRSYPHLQAPAPADSPKARFTAADLDAALAHYNQEINVSRDDLQELLEQAELAAYQRNLGALKCTDIMTRQPVSVEYGTTLDEAWALMRQRQVKALPVVDRVQRIVGIVTRADFIRRADPDNREGLAERLLANIKPSGNSHSDRPEVVGQIMTRQVRVASANRLAIELVPLFSQGSHHHVPVIDEDKRLIGIITQSDLVRALYKAVRPDA